jgi:hypothetical protein
MTRLYNRSLPMNRISFGRFAREVDDLIDEKNSDKIFSCATLSFASADGETPASDCEMNPTEFAIAFVRLANLRALMYDGMENASLLSSQTAKLMEEMNTR